MISVEGKFHNTVLTIGGELGRHKFLVKVMVPAIIETLSAFLSQIEGYGNLVKGQGASYCPGVLYRAIIGLTHDVNPNNLPFRQGNAQQIRINRRKANQMSG